jgi:hypothetical protein
MKPTILIAILGLAACGSSSSKAVDAPNGSGSDANNPLIDAPPPIDAAIDAPPAPAMITISGTASAPSVMGTTVVAGVTVGAYRSSNDTTPVKTATTDAQGNFTMTITTGGVALDGYLKGTKTGYADTYLYPEAPIAADFAGVPLNMLTSGNNGTFQLLSTIAQGNQMTGNGVIALEVLDAPLPAGNPVAGATVTTNPAASVYRYDNNGLPSAQATSTSTDGRAFGFNEAVGAHSVTAHKAGSTFKTHTVKAFADSLTTTFVSSP